MALSRVPSSWPPSWWKYHHGTPFCTGRITLSRRSSGRQAGRDRSQRIGLRARTTMSCGPSSAESDAARSFVVTRCPPAIRVRPLRRIASSCLPRASTETSCPVLAASRAAIEPPIAPGADDTDLHGKTLMICVCLSAPRLSIDRAAARCLNSNRIGATGDAGMSAMVQRVARRAWSSEETRVRTRAGGGLSDHRPSGLDVADLQPHHGARARAAAPFPDQPLRAAV